MPESNGPTSASTARPDSTTLMAFVATVLIGGGNAVAVRVSSLELPPFWGAAARSLAAAAIFWVILLVGRVAIPRGAALFGAVLYGAIGLGASYLLIYWGVRDIQASLLMVILSLGPLLTMFFAVVHGVEYFRWRGLAGALIALAGIAVGVGAEIGRSVPVASLLAVVAGAACIAEASVIYKLLPGAKPLQTNTIAFTTGALIQVLVSFAAGESRLLPSAPRTIAAFAYLVVLGSVVLFYLYLFVLSRWTASATSYAFLLFPLATIPMAALIVGEQVSLRFLAGAAVALIGVWVGALSRHAVPPAAQEPEVVAAETCEPPRLGCV